MTTRGQGHSLTFDQDSQQILTISNIFSRVTGLIDIIFYVEFAGAEGAKFVQMVKVT